MGTRPCARPRQRLPGGVGSISAFGSVVAQGLRLALGGLALGLLAALGFSRLASSLLFGVSESDPVTLATVSGLLVVVALLASYVPARRATRIDPVSALRSD